VLKHLCCRKKRVYFESFNVSALLFSLLLSVYPTKASMYSLVGLLLVLFLCCASGYVVDLDENTQAQIAEVVRVYVNPVCIPFVIYVPNL